MNLDRAVVVITGGGDGIGRASALKLAERGATVVVTDLKEEAADTTRELVAKAGGTAEAIACDVTNEHDIERLAAYVDDRFGRVDVLFNNAGGLVSGPLERIPIADWQWMFELNALSHVRTVQRFAPGMIERRHGWIVNTSSIGGLCAYSDDIAPYVMSKFAAAGFAEALALYLRPHGVGVSLLCPNKTLTDFRSRARLAGTDDATYGRSFVGLRGVTPEEAAELVCEGIESERYLLLTHPEDHESLLERIADYDAAFDAQVAVLAALPSR